MIRERARAMTRYGWPLVVHVDELDGNRVGFRAPEDMSFAPGYSGTTLREFAAYYQTEQPIELVRSLTDVMRDLRVLQAGAGLPEGAMLLDTVRGVAG